MRRLIIVLCALALTAPAFAQQTINNLGAGTTLTGSELFPIYQGSNPAVTTTATAIKTFVGAPAAANPTATAGPNAVNGSASTYMRSDAAPAIQKATLSLFGIVEPDGSGICITAGVISLCNAYPTGANPTATAGPTAVNGSAATFMRSDAAPAIQKGSASVFGIVEVDGTTITASGGVISSVSGGAGTVTSVATGCQATGGTITTSGTISTQEVITALTGTNPAIIASYCGGLENLNNASAQTPTIAVAGSTGFPQNWYTDICNIGAGAQTLTPASGTIGGAASYTIPAGTAAAPNCISIVSDAANTNYVIFTTQGNSGSGTITAGTTVTSGITSGDIMSSTSNKVADSGVAVSNVGLLSGTQTFNGAKTFSGTLNCTGTCQLSGTAFSTLATTTPGTGVATALGNALSAAGGVTSTIASGTSALGTSAISSGACASAVTTTATNVATTDVVTASFNGDPSGVTGYAPATTGMLTILSYPTANNVNFKVCNNTSASITPGAITLNWRVVR
jgi:hypothetical protein